MPYKNQVLKGAPGRGTCIADVLKFRDKVSAFVILSVGGPMETKKPSGAQNRKKKKAEIVQSRKNEEQRRTETGEPSARELLKPPPIGNPTAAVAYAADCALIALAEVQSDKHLTAEQRWSWVDKLVKSIGMTHSKAVMQNRLQQITEDEEPEHDEELDENPLKRRSSP